MYEGYYYNMETCCNSYAEMTDYTQQALEYAKTTQGTVSDTARYELRKLYQKYANPDFMSFDEYIKLLQDYE